MSELLNPLNPPNGQIQREEKHSDHCNPSLVFIISIFNLFIKYLSYLILIAVIVVLTIFNYYSSHWRNTEIGAIYKSKIQELSQKVEDQSKIIANLTETIRIQSSEFGQKLDDLNAIIREKDDKIDKLLQNGYSEPTDSWWTNFGKWSGLSSGVSHLVAGNKVSVGVTIIAFVIINYLITPLF